METLRSHRPSAFWTLAILLLCALPVPARAISLLNLGGGAFLEDTTQPQDYFSADFSHQTSTGTLLQDTIAGSLMTQAATPAGTVLVRGRASFGALGAEASLVLLAPGVGGQAHNGVGNVSVGFIDDITIVPDDPTLFFQTAYLRGTLRLTGSVFVDANNVPILGENDARSAMASAWNVRVDLFDGATNHAAVWNAQASVEGGFAPTYTGSPTPTVLDFELPIRLGSTQQLSVGMFVQSAGGALASRGDVSGSVSLFETLLWGGISSITTADGTPISYQLSSVSGTNWTQAATVPEPAVAWLLLTTILGVLAARGSRRLVARPA